MCIHYHENSTSQSPAEVPGGPSRYANKGEIGRKSGREPPPGVEAAMVDDCDEGSPRWLFHRSSAVQRGVLLIGGAPRGGNLVIS